MWKSVSPLYRDRGGCILRSGARRRRHVTLSTGALTRHVEQVWGGAIYSIWYDAYDWYRRRYLE